MQANQILNKIKELVDSYTPEGEVKKILDNKTYGKAADFYLGTETHMADPNYQEELVIRLGPPMRKEQIINKFPKLLDKKQLVRLAFAYEQKGIMHCVVLHPKFTTIFEIPIAELEKLQKKHTNRDLPEPQKSNWILAKNLLSERVETKHHRFKCKHYYFYTTENFFEMVIRPWKGSHKIFFNQA